MLWIASMAVGVAGTTRIVRIQSETESKMLSPAMKTQKNPFFVVLELARALLPVDQAIVHLRNGTGPELIAEDSVCPRDAHSLASITSSVIDHLCLHVDHHFTVYHRTDHPHEAVVHVADLSAHTHSHAGYDAPSRPEAGSTEPIAGKGAPDVFPNPVKRALPSTPFPIVERCWERFT